MLRFRKMLEAASPVTDKDLNDLVAVLHEKKFDKGEVILKEGQVCRYFYFILKGCIRSFGIEDGKEMNVNFFFEDEVACDFISFRMEKPSKVYLVAMEDCTVFYSAKTESAPLLDESDSLHKVLFRFFQQLYFKEEEHSNTFILLSPEERYLYLLEKSPHYLQRIPLTHLASYLGMSRETLTRIRKKIS